MSDYVGRCIALQSVPFFASGEQCQAQLCLLSGSASLSNEKSRHGDGGFACGGNSLRAGGVGLGIEAAFELLAQLYTRTAGYGRRWHIRTGVTGSPLHRLDVTAGDHQLVGGTGVTQSMKDDAGNSGCASCQRNFLRMSTGSTARPLGSRKHPAVAVSLRVEGFFPLQPFQPLLQLLPQGGGHEDGAAGGFSVLVSSREVRAIQRCPVNAEAPLSKIQRSLSGPSIPHGHPLQHKMVSGAPLQCPLLPAQPGCQCRSFWLEVVYLLCCILGGSFCCFCTGLLTACSSTSEIIVVVLDGRPRGFTFRSGRKLLPTPCSILSDGESFLYRSWIPFHNEINRIERHTRALCQLLSGHSLIV